MNSPSEEEKEKKKKSPLPGYIYSRIPSYILAMIGGVT